MSCQSKHRVHYTATSPSNFTETRSWERQAQFLKFFGNFFSQQRSHASRIAHTYLYLLLSHSLCFKPFFIFIFTGCLTVSSDPPKPTPTFLHPPTQKKGFAYSLTRQVNVRVALLLPLERALSPWCKINTHREKRFKGGRGGGSK